mmetsp:Transcript_22/g.66  ORF Transcript_22/g.66 Transcript_22/m.66 type:complete len:130 (-) Transcript_22:178-567(-)
MLPCSLSLNDRTACLQFLIHVKMGETVPILGDMSTFYTSFLPRTEGGMSKRFNELLRGKYDPSGDAPRLQAYKEWSATQRADHAAEGLPRGGLRPALTLTAAAEALVRAGLQDAWWSGGSSTAQVICVG